ncbi:hypothetical protein, partial [Brevundimonas sp.]|uniref:hypothetical protein n=1 Tax=Brevundimonas sp. TaxID=1871086 RepID=UPI00289EC63C
MIDFARMGGAGGQRDQARKQGYQAHREPWLFGSPPERLNTQPVADRRYVSPQSKSGPRIAPGAALY